MNERSKSIVLILLLCTGFSTFAIAESGQKVSFPFVAVAEEVKKGNCAKKRWQVGAEAIYADVKMTSMNNYISWINASWDGDIEKMDKATGFTLYASYFFNDYIGAGISYERLSSDVSGTTVSGNFKAEVSVDGVLGNILLRYPVNSTDLLLGARLGIGYYNADYSEKENGWELSGDSSSIGYTAAVSLAYCLNENWSIGIDGGYRYLKADDFDINLVSPGNPEVELDFSGFYGMAGFSYHW